MDYFVKGYLKSAKPHPQDAIVSGPVYPDNRKDRASVYFSVVSSGLESALAFSEDDADRIVDDGLDSVIGVLAAEGKFVGLRTDSRRKENRTNSYKYLKRKSFDSRIPKMVEYDDVLLNGKPVIVTQRFWTCYAHIKVQQGCSREKSIDDKDISFVGSLLKKAIPVLQASPCRKVKWSGDIVVVDNYSIRFVSNMVDTLLLVR
jgi:hypothetical protein